MTIRTPLRLATFVPIACAAALLAGCGSSGGGAPATGGSSSQPASSTAAGGSQPASSASSSAKCTDLTAAAASASLGKAVTVTADTGGATLPGLSVCDVTVADEGYPIQLSVDTADAQLLFTGDEQSAGGKPLSGVGDKAFTSAIGVETISGNVDIQVVGPAGPVLSGNFATPTAIAKAMVGALH